jgi:hypothetical protein
MTAPTRLGIVGTVAPGLFAQEGRCWRMLYEDPVGQAGHGIEPVTLRRKVPSPHTTITVP